MMPVSAAVDCGRRRGCSHPCGGAGRRVDRRQGQGRGQAAGAVRNVQEDERSVPDALVAPDMDAPLPARQEKEYEHSHGGGGDTGNPLREWDHGQEARQDTDRQGDGRREYREPGHRWPPAEANEKRLASEQTGHAEEREPEVPWLGRGRKEDGTEEHDPGQVPVKVGDGLLPLLEDVGWAALVGKECLSEVVKLLLAASRRPVQFLLGEGPQGLGNSGAFIKRFCEQGAPSGLAASLGVVLRCRFARD